MSAIFGLLHFDGSLVEAEDLARMQKALAYWGKDGGGVWQQGNMGLGCIIRQVTPESLYETFPVTGAGGRLLLAGSARLDNREDLCRMIGIPQAEWASTPDTRLLLLAYERWGCYCPDRLLGDWSMAVWDLPRRKLFIARDHFGMAGLYYYYNSRFLAFASGIKALLALRQVPKKINHFRLAQILTAWFRAEGETGYEDIFRLPSAHSLTITGQQIVKRCYWRAEDIPELHLSRQEDYHERFLEVYQAAVNCRLRGLGVVGGTLSGGLDSGSVCTLAARELAARGKRLPVFSSIPIVPSDDMISPTHFGDESPYIEATTRCAGNIDITYIPAADVTPLEGIRRVLELTDEPSHAASNYYWFSALMRHAQEDNIDILLTGQFGNATVSWTGGPVNLWPLLLKADWPGLQQEFRLLSGSGWNGLWHLLRCQLFGPLVTQARFLIDRWQPEDRQPWESFSAINNDWARSLNLTEKMLLDGHTPNLREGSNFQQFRFRSLSPRTAVFSQMMTELAAGYSLEVWDPTLDKRLIEFCLALPNHCYYHLGKNRLLLRESFAKLMPPQVLWNSRKGRQAADIAYRVLKDISEIEDILQQLQRTTLGRECLDLPKMQGLLDSLKIRITPQNTRQCHVMLLRAVMVGLFLLRFEKNSIDN